MRRAALLGLAVLAAILYLVTVWALLVFIRVVGEEVPEPILKPIIIVLAVVALGLLLALAAGALSLLLEAEAAAGGTALYARLVKRSLNWFSTTLTHGFCTRCMLTPSR